MTPSTSDARSRRRSAEPFLWLLFSAGGMVTALVAPVLLLLFGLAFPLGWLDAPDHGHLLAMVRNPITKLVVLVLVVLALFHAAHRFRFVLDHGLQLGRFDRVIGRVGLGDGGLDVAHYVKSLAGRFGRRHGTVRTCTTTTVLW